MGAGSRASWRTNADRVERSTSVRPDYLATKEIMAGTDVIDAKSTDRGAADFRDTDLQVYLLDPCYGGHVYELDPLGCEELVQMVDLFSAGELAADRQHVTCL